MRLKGYITLSLVCLFYWLLDSIWTYVSFEYNLKKMIFSEPTSYLDTFLLRVSPYQVVSRLMVVVLFVILGVLILEFTIKRQAAHKERREAHDTLLTILNSIDATIYVADMQNHEILFMNRVMIERVGGDFSGRPCYAVFWNNTRICDHCNNDQLLDESGRPKGSVVREEHHPVTKTWSINHDRAIKWIDGRIVRLQIATDITQLKRLQKKQLRAEAQLQQALKMESIGNLAGGIAHDFNNILSAVIGYTELALDDAEKGSLLEANLQEVMTAGKRARDLVKQILTFARKSDQQRNPIQIDLIAKEGLKLIRSTIPTTNEIRQNLENHSLVMGNPTQLHQLFMNLCTNAAQAMADTGGILEVNLADVELDTASLLRPPDLNPGRYVKISVSDTGPGIDPAIIALIFDPYFMTKKIGKGSGMGLAVVLGIVESYDGKIVAESEPGKGTLFIVYLPMIKKQTAHSPHSHSDTALPSGTERILIVDDEWPIVKMESQILERLGYRVSTCTGSLEALALFSQKPTDFDLVITDMTMPDMTGDRLAAALMEIRPDIPVILCTGYSNRNSEEAADALGIKAFAYKPIVKADLAKTIRKVIDKKNNTI